MDVSRHTAIQSTKQSQIHRLAKDAGSGYPLYGAHGGNSFPQGIRQRVQ